MIRRPELLGAGQFADELGGVVDQHGEMLRADPVLATAVFEPQERDLLAFPLAGETAWRPVAFVHGLSSTV